MIDIKLKYQASVFTPSIDANSTNISQLMGLFVDKGFIPTTHQELSNINPTPQLRFSLNSPNNEWSISFRSNRIDIEKNQIDAKGNNIGNIEAFCDDVIDILLKILKKYPQKANRLALASNLVLKEMTSKALDEIYPKLFNPTQTYLDNKPIEWNFRTASRVNKKINNQDESLNFIIEIGRFTGQMNFNQSIVPLDRIAINPDLNTIPNNTKNRFDEADITSFYQEVHIWYNELLNEFIEKIK